MYRPMGHSQQLLWLLSAAAKHIHAGCQKASPFPTKGLVLGDVSSGTILSF